MTRINGKHTSGSENYGYAGRQLDRESGLYYYRARMYNLTLGRFMSRDPKGFGGHDVNLYRYGFNNSLRFRDPKGTDVLDLTEENLTSSIAYTPNYQNAANDHGVLVIVTDAPDLWASDNEIELGLTQGLYTNGDIQNISVQVSPYGESNDFVTISHEFVHVNQLTNGAAGTLDEFEAYVQSSNASGSCPYAK